MDTVQQGTYFARGMIIISEKYQEIANKIDLKIDRDFTYLNVRSDYSSKNTCQLFRK